MLLFHPLCLPVLIPLARRNGTLETWLRGALCAAWAPWGNCPCKWPICTRNYPMCNRSRSPFELQRKLHQTLSQESAPLRCLPGWMRMSWKPGASSQAATASRLILN